MLIPLRFLDGIRAGKVTLAFRRWERPRAKPGGRQRTAVGELAIESVDPVDRADITERDARSAGYRTLDELLATLVATRRSGASGCDGRGRTRAESSASGRTSTRASSAG